MNDPKNILSVVDAPPTTHADEKDTRKAALTSGSGPYDALVLDAKLRQSLVTVRSLGQRGMRVAASEIENLAANVPAFSSRWCQEAFVAPSYEQSPAPYVEYLEQLLAHTQARVIITSSDGTLAVIRQYREQLEQRVRVALAKEPALAIAVNKDQTLAIAKQLGIGVPLGVHVNSVSEVPEVLREVGLPAVVKPVESWLWGDQQSERLICQLVTTPEEAKLAVEALTHLGGSVLFQQFLSGRREAVNLLYSNGEFYARFAQWAKRTQPPLGGTSVFRQSIAIPSDIGEQADRLVRAIDLEGYSEVEFRRDAAGKPYLMEINPRLSASIEIAVRSGVDFPYLLYQWASGEHIDRVTSYRTGGWMRYLEGDLLTTFQSLTQRGRPGVMPPSQAFLDFVVSFFIPSGYDYVDVNDLRPCWTATLDFARTLRRRLYKNFSLRRKSR
jgi:predicted ATP-grasp superfamily ATP-dependent carboligase